MLDYEKLPDLYIMLRIKVGYDVSPLHTCDAGCAGRQRLSLDGTQQRDLLPLRVAHVTPRRCKVPQRCNMIMIAKATKQARETTKSRGFLVKNAPVQVLSETV